MTLKDTPRRALARRVSQKAKSSSCRLEMVKTDLLFFDLSMETRSLLRKWCPIFRIWHAWLSRPIKESMSAMLLLFIALMFFICATQSLHLSSVKEIFNLLKSNNHPSMVFDSSRAPPADNFFKESNGSLLMGSLEESGLPNRSMTRAAAQARRCQDSGKKRPTEIRSSM